jgi:hypothetical protein
VVVQPKGLNASQSFGESCSAFRRIEAVEFSKTKAVTIIKTLILQKLYRTASFAWEVPTIEFASVHRGQKAVPPEAASTGADCYHQSHELGRCIASSVTTTLKMSHCFDDCRRSSLL